MTSIKFATISANLPQLSMNFIEADNSLENISTAMHLHHEIELMRIKSGRVLYRIYNSAEEFIAEDGDVVFVNASIAHETESLVDKTVVEILQFNPQVIVGEAGESFRKYISAFLNTQNETVSLFKADSNTALTQYFENIGREYKEKEPGFEFNLFGNLYLILGYLFKNGSVLPRVLDSGEITKFSKLFEYIEQNYMNKITMEEICRKNYISQSHFCRIFKITTGKSFVQYLNFRRAYEAERLLFKTNMSITEIALAVGFSTTSYFDRVFRKYYMLSPSKYRNLKGKK